MRARTLELRETHSETALSYFGAETSARSWTSGEVANTCHAKHLFQRVLEPIFDFVALSARNTGNRCQCPLRCSICLT